MADREPEKFTVDDPLVRTPICAPHYDDGGTSSRTHALTRVGGGAACPAMPDQLPLAGKSILVIEDELLIAISVESLLNEAGAATVTIASSLAQAQNALTQASYHAAVVDLRLTDGDASFLIEALSGKEIPVVVTTGDSFVQPDLSKTVAVLRKPYSDRDLIKVMTWLTRAPEERDP